MHTMSEMGENKESAAIMSAVMRYFGDISETSGSYNAESSLIEALRIYFDSKHD